MKTLVAAACLALTPTAWAEHGTQLSQWRTSSPAQTYGAPEPTAASAQPTGPATVQAGEPNAEKKEEKVSAGSAVLTPEQLAKLQGFFFSASIDQYMGLGTFIDTSKYANAGMWVNAFFSYRKHLLGRSFSLGIQPFGLTGFTYEYTMPDNSTGRRFTWADARVSLSMPAVYKNAFTGITVTPSINVTIPTTLESWHAGLITRLGAGLSLSRVFSIPIGQLETGVSGIASWGIFTRTANVVTNSGGVADAQGAHRELCRTGESVCDIAGNNPAVAAQGSAGVTWLATDFFFVSIGYSLIASWRYAPVSQVDPYTAQGIDSNGNPDAVAGMAMAPLQSASFSVAVNLTDVISLSAYIYNYAPLFTANYKSVRFPWVDYTGLSNNNTIIGLSVAATY